jgi:pyrroline-5-carboxylate reductase
MSEVKTIVMIGCGNMGMAILQRLAENESLQFIVVKPSDPPSNSLKQNIRFVRDISELPTNITPELVILAVKPKIMGDVLQKMVGLFSHKVLFLTVAAGLSLSFYEKYLGSSAKIVRTMPNTPVEIGLGVIGVVGNNNIELQDRQLVDNYFRALGKVVFLENEAMIDAITAVSGSGVAYVYYFMEQMIEAARGIGFEPDVAKELVIQTVLGAANLANCKFETSLSELREAVTSKGGTTAAALQQLQKNNDFAKIIFLCVEAALQRAEQLNAENTNG